MFKFAGITFVITIFVSACAAPPSIGGNYQSLNWVDTKTIHSPFGPNKVKPMLPATNVEEWQPPVIPKPAPVPPMITWVSLDSWAARHGFAQPRLLSSQPVTAYTLGSSNGVMVLAIGSREATWNGIEIHLGFGPQIIDGQICVYGLDLQKNVEPLLCDPPLAFPATKGIIVIDPGHGGSNVGTHSILGGRFEKEFTLDWAKRLAPLLEQEGWRVLLTRTKDVYVTNADRVIFANKHRADLFISLHFNSDAPDKTPTGIETYCLTPTGMPSTVTRGYADPWFARYPNNSYDARNLQLAVRLEGALVHATGMEDRGVCRARFIQVLPGQHRPAVLIEAGFLSNPGDARRIETPAFRQKLAEAVADSFSSEAKATAR